MKSASQPAHILLSWIILITRKVKGFVIFISYNFMYSTGHFKELILFHFVLNRNVFFIQRRLEKQNVEMWKEGEMVNGRNDL